MANKIYQVGETDITWLASGGTELLTLTSLGVNAGRQGALHDFGAMATARAQEYIWRFFMQFNVAPVVDDIINIYWKSSDGTHPDNDDGTGDIVVSHINKLKNLRPIGRMIVDEASATPEFVASISAPIRISPQHGAPVIWNGTATVFSTTPADHGFILTPVPLEAQ